ncbi:MAG: redoxin domain-containing protein [Phycisphaerae bacterium]|nr:redoxin domain-containing protein [Phycisphaerae bacterium]
MKKSIATLLLAGLASTLAVGTFAIADDAPATQAPGTGAPAQDTKTDKKDKKEEKREKKDGEKSKGTAKIGEAAPNFTLKTTDGKDWSLSDAKGKIVVLEWCNPECPACQRVTSDGTVASMIKDANGVTKDVVFVMVNSSARSQSSLDATAGYLKEHKLDVPAVLDTDGKVGRMYGAKTTPHCYVIDASGVLRYEGAIDDGNPGKKGTNNYVVNAIKQIKAGETVSPEQTRAYGCSVKYKD